MSSEDDIKFVTLDEDSMVTSWLWNIMQPKINRVCMFLTKEKKSKS